MSTALCEFGQKSDEATKAGSIAMTRAVAVDWNAPHLQKLLQRVQSWQLDQRGGHAPQAVRLFLGWNAPSARPGLLV